MRINNKILLFIILFFSLSQVSDAKNVEVDYLKQNIFVESGYPNWPTGLTPSYPALSSPNAEQTYFHRWLGEKANRISKILNQQQDIEKLDTVVKIKILRGKKATFNISKYVNRKVKRFKRREAKAFYFNYKNRNVGHLILQQSEIILDDSYYDLISVDGYKNEDLFTVEKLLGKIKSLPSSDVLLPNSQRNITLYKVNRNGYTEFYGLLEKNGHLYMLIDGFIPTSFFDSYIKKALTFTDKMISKGEWCSDSP